MIMEKIYKVSYKGVDSLVLRVCRTNLEDAFDVYEDSVIEEISSTAQPGFLNDKGVFLTPEEALPEALAAGQISDFFKKVIEVNNIKNLQKSFLSA